MARLRAALALASAVSSLVIPTQPVLTRYAASKVLEAAEAKAKDEDWPVTICVCDGGGVPLCPEAQLDDGLLDLTLFPQPDADHVLGLLSRLLHETEAPVESYAKTTRFSSLTVESDAELSLNLDGEPMQAKSLKVEVLPGAVRFVTGPAPEGLVS